MTGKNKENSDVEYHQFIKP